LCGALDFVKVRDLIDILEAAGWTLKATKGSHRQFRHPEKGMVVTVPGQSGKDVPIGTLKAILKSVGIARRKIFDLYRYLEKGSGLLGAYVPDLPGVIAVGESRPEVERLIHEAIEFHIEGMVGEGLAIPPVTSYAGEVEVHSAA